MKKNPKSHLALCGAVTLLGAAGVVSQFVGESSSEAQVTASKPTVGTERPSQARVEEAALAAQGLLWEPGSSIDQQIRSALPVQAEPLHAAVGRPAGERVTLKLSDRFPALAGEVTGTFTQNDGTVVTHIQIDGNPAGTLTLQENQPLGFFLGQLYYDNHPVAYEFRPSGNRLMATRHPLSNLICSTLNSKRDGIESIGLPPLDLAKVEAANQYSDLIQEAKAVNAAAVVTPGLSVADVSITEGNSGTSNLTFTITLSKASTKTVSVRYMTQNTSAIAGSDYTAKSGTVSFSVGSTSRTVAVAIIGDTVPEATETFQLLLYSPTNATISDSTAIGTIVDNDTVVPPSGPPILNSLPGAAAVAYLDMDGQVVSGTSWLGGATINATGISATYTQAQMTDIWQQVKEAYSPFEINVTTDEAVYLAAASNRRIRCIITPDNEWYGAVGGVAYTNSFVWTGDTPCWVFSDQLANNTRYIADSSAHEIGHTLSLKHDGRTSPVEGYYAGHGTGEVGWAPIMGVGYYKSLVQWSRGEYLNANNLEDDLAQITTLNGFGYRADQQPATPVGAPALAVAGTSVTGAGIIETRDDEDTFTFATTGGTVSLTALGDPSSQNVDLQIEILDAAGNVLATANPDLLTDASISTSLAAGSYCVRVSGVGRGAPLVDGYSDYASIGQYSISGTVP